MQHKNNIQVNTPRVMFAATTVTCGVLAALKKQNIKVQAYKCGPDYIDPMFHRTVLGIDTGNLDTFFADADAIGRILARDTKDAELIVMEGVMGYYDGVGGTTTMASSYELSKVTKTPVVLIVDAKGASVTLAAIIRGIMEYKKDSRIVGVILNRVSPMFYSRIKHVIETECGIPVLGYLPEDASFAVPSRHLGLLQPDEMQKQRDWVETVAKAARKTIDIDGILEIAAQAEMLQIQKATGETEKSKFPAGYRIGVARDAASAHVRGYGSDTCVLFSADRCACVGGGCTDLWRRLPRALCKAVVRESVDACVCLAGIGSRHAVPCRMWRFLISWQITCRCRGKCI